MADLSMMVLGAGHEVGRSCVVVAVEGTFVMLDCGMHLGYRDERRFPDFKLLPFHSRLTEMLTAVLVTHFHLDHCAALPYLTGAHGYRGPIYTTHPTKAIMPIMLEDYRKTMTERQGGREWYSAQDIQQCMAQTIGVQLNAELEIAPGVCFTALYAGHVLGAAQFHLSIHGRSILYTGDYNTVPDRHLRAADVRRLHPDLLISEATYPATVRDSKRSREREFTSEVLATVQRGGKVLVPVFAVGRAQELLLLVQDTWRRAGLAGRVPLYFAGAMAERATALYRAYVAWAAAGLLHGAARAGAFAFNDVQPWHNGLVDAPGPCVLFATPGMLNGGTSLEVFKAWAPDPINMVALPGYQVAGTIGSKLVAGHAGELQLGKASVSVQCKVRVLAFSAHTDAAGIQKLITVSRPRSVMFVHGDPTGMAFMASQIYQMMGIPSRYPPTGGDWERIATQPLPVPVSLRVGDAIREDPARQTEAAAAVCRDKQKAGWGMEDLRLPSPRNQKQLSGVLLGRIEAGHAVDLQLLPTDAVAAVPEGCPVFRLTWEIPATHACN